MDPRNDRTDGRARQMIAVWNGLSVARRSAVVFGGCALALLAAMNRGINIFDEGIIYGGAMRLLAGQMVHRDFYSVYGPGSYALLAGLFKVFGPGFLIGRIAGIVVAAITVALVHAILAERVRPGIALGTAGLAALWMMTEPSYLAPIYPCMALSLLAAWIMLRPGAARRPALLLSAGALSGVTALFRYDTGFFVLVALAACAAAVLLRAEPGKAGLRGALRAVVLLGAGAGAVFLPFAAAYLLQAPLAAFRHDIIDYTLQYYGRMRGLPFPGPLELAANPHALGVYLPLAIVAASAPGIVADWRRIEPAGAAPHIPASLLLAVLALLLFTKGMVRVSTLHMLMSLVPATALAGLTLERWTARGGLARSAARVAAAAMVLAAGTGLRGPLHYFKDFPAGASWVWLAERGGLIADTPDYVETCPPWEGMAGALLEEKYARTAWYLARHSAPADRVLVGLARTDRVLLNAMVLNYAANRLPGTHWSQFDPGLQNRLDIQRDMVRELTANDVRWVVRDASFEGTIEPNGSALSSGVTLLDDTIAARFRMVGQSGPVSVWLRKDVPAPDTTRDPAACRLAPA